MSSSSSSSSSSDESDAATARQAFIQSVLKRDHSGSPRNSNTSPRSRASPTSSFFSSGTASPSEEISTLFESFATSAAGLQAKSQEGSEHLLASLNSARGSIQSLEVANKDLLDALASRNVELEKAKTESYEWQNKHDVLNGTVGLLRREIEALQTANDEKDKLLAAKSSATEASRNEVELLRKQYVSMQSAMLKLAGQINDIRDEGEIQQAQAQECES